MNEEELRKFARCSLCQEKIGATGLPLFWRISIEQFGIDLGLVKRADGLAAMLGGNSHIARVMGSVDELTEPMMNKLTLCVCQDCAVKQQFPIAALCSFDGVPPA